VIVAIVPDIAERVKVIIATDKATPIRQPDADRDRAFVRKLRCVKVVIDRDYAQANEDLAPRHQLLRGSTLKSGPKSPSKSKE
jgi:hypothetical protein